jgi:hypothetical protein
MNLSRAAGIQLSDRDLMRSILYEVTPREKWNTGTKFFSFQGLKEAPLVQFSYYLGFGATLTITLNGIKDWSSCISVDGLWEITRTQCADTHIRLECRDSTKSVVVIELHYELIYDRFIPKLVLKSWVPLDDLLKA